MSRPSDEELSRLYVHDSLSTRRIAAEFGTNHVAVQRWLEEAGIKRRERSCAFWHKKGVPPPALGRTGPLCPMYGRTTPPEVRAKISESMRGKHSLDKHPGWKGGRTHNANGYVKMKRPNHPDADDQGYVFEHRIVAEESIGRQLNSGEVVHHVNGNKKDNRPENLQVMTNGDHTRHHHKGVKRSEQHRQKCRERQLAKDPHDLPWYRAISADEVKGALADGGSLKAACAILGVSKRTFYAKVDENQLTAWYKTWMEAKRGA